MAYVGAARGATSLNMASCFNPRHAIRATDNTGTYDVLLCFECGRAGNLFAERKD